MATYTVVNGRLICTGTDITTQGIVDAVNLNLASLDPVRTEPVSATFTKTPRSPAKCVIVAEINIGDGGITPSIWTTNFEDITLRAEHFRIDGGSFLLGSKSASNSITTPSNFCFDCPETGNNGPAWERWLFENGGSMTAYGGSLFNNRVATLTYTTGDIYLEEVYVSIDYSFGDGGSYFGDLFVNNPTITFKNCTFNDQAGVGLKLYQYVNFVLEGNKITDNLYGIQAGPVPLVLVDTEIDSNVRHTIPNIGPSSDVTFINPDFINLRALGIQNTDITRVAFRYNFKAFDLSNNLIDNLKITIIDGNGDTTVDNELTVAGEISTLPTYKNIKCLLNGTFVRTARTDRSNHTLYAVGYLYDTLPRSLTVDRDIEDNAIFVDDFDITTGKNLGEAAALAAALAITTQSNTELAYDHVKALWVRDFDTTIPVFPLKREGDTLDVGDLFFVVSDATGEGILSDTGVLINAPVYDGSITTTAAIDLNQIAENKTIKNASAVSITTLPGVLTVDNTILDLAPGADVTDFIELNGGSYRATADGTYIARGKLASIIDPNGFTITVEVAIIRKLTLTGIPDGLEAVIKRGSVRLQPPEIVTGQTFVFDYEYSGQDIPVDVTIGGVADDGNAYERQTLPLALKAVDQVVPTNFQLNQSYIN